ncbi:MAG: phospholipase D-like domain-containing protein [Polyangiales bacterium]
MSEPSDSHGWSDNHVCSTVDMGLRWSNSGPIAGMRCTAITEPGDPDGWGDNFLCLPNDSQFSLGWSNAGPIPGRLCFPWVEPQESSVWRDNQLCVWWRAVDPAPQPSLPRYRAVFSSRSGTNAADGAVEDAIVDLIDRAVPASRVRVAVYRFTRARPATALIQAAQRGVDVRVVVDGDAEDSPGSEVPRLISALGRSRVTVCGAPGTACLGTGIMHHKTFLFSELDDGSRNVVLQASHNLTTGQLTRHNNAVIIRGDSNLFAAYERAFADQRRDTVHANYYRVASGNFRTRGYFYPRESGDTVAGVIDNVSCAGTARIRVAMAFFTDARLQVARALARRAQAGCDVQVVIGNAGIPAGRQALAALRDGGARVTLYPARGGNWALHSKYLLIDARYAGSSANRRLVFTGSHNWTGGALRRNDETMLRVENDDVFAAFMADWAHVRDSAGRR